MQNDKWNYKKTVISMTRYFNDHVQCFESARDYCNTLLLCYATILPSTFTIDGVGMISLTIIPNDS